MSSFSIFQTEKLYEIFSENYNLNDEYKYTHRIIREFIRSRLTSRIFHDSHKFVESIISFTKEKSLKKKVTKVTKEKSY